jgi:hypothetical protein
VFSREKLVNQIIRAILFLIIIETLKIESHVSSEIEIELRLSLSSRPNIKDCTPLDPFCLEEVGTEWLDARLRKDDCNIEITN